MRCATPRRRFRVRASPSRLRERTRRPPRRVSRRERHRHAGPGDARRHDDTWILLHLRFGRHDTAAATVESGVAARETRSALTWTAGGPSALAARLRPIGARAGRRPARPRGCVVRERRRGRGGGVVPGRRGRRRGLARRGPRAPRANRSGAVADDALGLAPLRRTPAAAEARAGERSREGAPPAHVAPTARLRPALGHATSKRPAAPMPPPMHIVTTTYFTPRRFPSMSACPTMRAPLIP